MVSVVVGAEEDSLITKIRIKILAIFAMIFFLFIMASGGIAATGGPLVFHYWKHSYGTRETPCSFLR